MDPRLSGQNCKFSKFLLSLSSQMRLGYKEKCKVKIISEQFKSDECAFSLKEPSNECGQIIRPQVIS